MTTEEIKQQMMGLWKTNFQDSDEYIKLIFDQYFDPEYIEYEVKDGRIVASLIAIPYTFGNNNYAINSVYLCGLSTYKKYRGEGIMRSLLHRIEQRMREKGYAFMFLIPAHDGLNRYYNDRGFINGFYRWELHYTSLHDFSMDYFSTLAEEDDALQNVKKRYFERLHTDIIEKKDVFEKEINIEELTDFIFQSESAQRGLCLYQDKGQIETFLREAVLSGGKIVVCRNGDDEIAGIGIYSFNESEIKEQGRFVINYASLCKLRESVLRSGGGRNLTVYQLGYEKSNDGKSVWSPMFSTILPEASQVGAVGTMERVYNPAKHSKIYGMVRILSVSEILKFLSKCRKDLKYSILVRLENSGKIMKFSAKNGLLVEKEIGGKLIEGENDPDEYKNKRIMYIRDQDGNQHMVIRERDFGEILFRRPTGERLVEDVFGLPALNGKISLLLD